jgi:hypothetical protein
MLTTPSRPDALDRLLAEPRLLLKRLVLLVGAAYFTMVALSNAINLVATASGSHWTFLNSTNVAYVESISKAYGTPHWIAVAAVLAATIAETIGAVLFWRAIVAIRTGRTPTVVWAALAWNVLVWTGFIVGVEFFLAYTSESTFRELLALGLLMALVVALVPDDPPAEVAVTAVDAIARPADGTARARDLGAARQ